MTSSGELVKTRLVRESTRVELEAGPSARARVSRSAGRKESRTDRLSHCRGPFAVLAGVPTRCLTTATVKAKYNKRSTARGGSKPIRQRPPS